MENLTPLEKQVLQNIVNSDYQCGDATNRCIIDHAVWSFSATNEKKDLAGALGSLVKKGLAGVDHQPKEDPICWITEAGFEALYAPEAPAEEPYDPIAAAHAAYVSPADRMYESDEWVAAQNEAGEEPVDLFDTPEQLPAEVQAILEKYSSGDIGYEGCAALVAELNVHGYTCDYGLDGQPHSLAKLGQQFTAPGQSYWNETGVYQKEYSELYDKLVPGNGMAETLHGELIRAISRLAHEYNNNGNCNACDAEWGIEDEDDEYAEEEILSVEVAPMYAKFLGLIADNVPGTEEAVGEVTKIIIKGADNPRGDYFSDANQQHYNELADRVIYHVLTTLDSSRPDDYTN